MIPKIRKKLCSFLANEDGKLTKQNLLSLGAFLSSAVVSGVLLAKHSAAAHVNNILLDSGSNSISVEHDHHQSHSNHSSHSNFYTTYTTYSTTGGGS